MQKEGWLKIVQYVALFGVLLSIYLTWNHYQTSSFCDFSATISCAAVNSSIYSEMWGVPVALLGMIWFLFLYGMARKAEKRDIFLSMMVWWSSLGILFVAYFVAIEILLKALCPLCTVAHILIVGVWIFSLWWSKKARLQHSWRDVWRAGKSFWIGGLVLMGVLFLSFNLSSEKVNHDVLAQCLTENGVRMYGSYRCGVCAKTKAMFGASFQYIHEVECHPRGPNSQYGLCSEKKIEGTPTWTMERQGVELKRQVGFLSTDQLKEFGGCL